MDGPIKIAVAAQNCGACFTDFCTSLVAFGDQIMGGSCSNCFKGRRNPTAGEETSCAFTQTLDMIREGCFPEYLPTESEPLEVQRAKLTLALAGQFTVVILRLSTGHVSGAVVGVVLFVAGNRARCTLQSSWLTAYVCMGAATGLTDSVGVLQRLVSTGGSLLRFPLAEHLGHDLTSLACLLAPLAELTGARLAWGSYLTPTALLRSQKGSSSSWSASRPHFNLDTGSCLSLGTPSSASAAQCTQCGESLSALARRGSGRFSEEIYCQECWALWATRP